MSGCRFGGSRRRLIRRYVDMFEGRSVLTGYCSNIGFDRNCFVLPIAAAL